jgi:hypothetical protein
MSDWWPDCLDADGSLDADGKEAITDKQAREQTRMWKRMVLDALGVEESNDCVLRVRRCAACQLAAIATDACLSKEHAGQKRNFSHTAQRLAVGSSAALAAATGGVLAAGLSGLPAHVFGIVVLIVGIATAAASAVSPEADYQRYRGKARQYEQLWRDVWAYATLTLPTASPGSIAGKLEQFSAASKAVGNP